jgi:hypothetical protein
MVWPLAAGLAAGVGIGAWFVHTDPASPTPITQYQAPVTSVPYVPAPTYPSPTEWIVPNDPWKGKLGPLSGPDLLTIAPCVAIPQLSTCAPGQLVPGAP